jgi:dihydroxyacid dehydratase/phosphogluconate dehydratase
VGGPIAIVKNGDRITIDAEKHEINLEVPQEEIERRLSKWKQPKPRLSPRSTRQVCGAGFFGSRRRRDR